MGIRLLVSLWWIISSQPGEQHCSLHLRFSQLPVYMAAFLKTSSQAQTILEHTVPSLNTNLFLYLKSQNHLDSTPLFTAIPQWLRGFLTWQVRRGLHPSATLHLPNVALHPHISRLFFSSCTTFPRVRIPTPAFLCYSHSVTPSTRHTGTQPLTASKKWSWFPNAGSLPS